MQENINSSDELEKKVENKENENILARQKTADIKSLTCGELVDHLAVLLEEEKLPVRKLVDEIKSLFYSKISKLEGEEKQKAELQETRLGDLLKLFRDKDRERIAILEEQMKRNKEEKDGLLKQFSGLFDSQEDFGKIFASFKEIREKWDTIGAVDPQSTTSLQNEYNELRERFYDLKHINDEYRDLDFKKNLELKTNILAKMKALCEAEDVVKALKDLQLLQAEWNTTGPIAKELRDDMRQEFKEVSTSIYKRHQDYFDEKKKQEQTNAEKKAEICEQISQLAAAERSKASQWEDDTKKVIALQKEWKEVGSVSRKDNELLYGNFSRACDAFFMSKSVFYDQRKELINQTYEDKKVIIDKAKALQDSEEWDSTAQKLKDLQKEWQQITGVAPTRYSEVLWNEFRSACDHFFSRLKEVRGVANKEQNENLKKKEEIITRLNELQGVELTPEVVEEINSLRQDWYNIGFVPFKKKNSINKAFSTAIKHFGNIVRQDRAQRRLEGYEASIKDISNKDELQRERQRMVKIMERMKQEAQTFETNMSMLNVSNPKSPLLKGIRKKQEKLQEDIRLMQEKINLLEDKLS